MKVVRKILRGILNTISILVIIAALIMLLSVLMTRNGNAPSFFGFSLFRVMSGSMEPTLRTDSLIVVHRTDPKDIREGDVISFYSRDPSLNGAVNTHRVIEIVEKDGERSFITKGDANQIADRYETQEKDVVGTVVFSSIILGTLVRLISNPIVFVPLILVPLLLLLTTNFIKTVRLSKQMMQEALEEDAEEAASDDPPEQNADPQTD